MKTSYEFKTLPSSEESERDEEDIVITDSRLHGYALVATCGGVMVGVSHDSDELAGLVMGWMEREQFFPNIFYINDHGNTDQWVVMEVVA